MKMTSLFKMSVLGAGLVMAMGANAADGTVNVSGTLITAGCQIQGESLNVSTTSFGTLSPSAFPTIGSISDKKDISIQLVDCPASVTSVKFMFLGVSTAKNPTLISLDKGSTASGLGIALYLKDGAQIPVSTFTDPYTIDAATGTAKIDLQAAVMSIDNEIKGGSFVANGGVSMSYN